MRDRDRLLDEERQSQASALQGNRRVALTIRTDKQCIETVCALEQRIGRRKNVGSRVIDLHIGQAFAGHLRARIGDCSEANLAVSFLEHRRQMRGASPHADDA
jgi:hypothetical protein